MQRMARVDLCQRRRDEGEEVDRADADVEVEVMGHWKAEELFSDLV